MRFAKRLLLKYVKVKFKLLSLISDRIAAKAAFNLFVTPQVRNKKQPPHVFECAEKLKTVFNDTSIVGYRWNHPQTKKVLILHGFESSAVNFGSFVEPLVAKNYEVLAFDAPAHGRSGGKQIHAIIYKQFIQFIVEQFGPVHNFITHSFGGLALSLVLEETPHDETWRVVFIAPATESTTAMDRFFQLVDLNEDIRKEFDKLITAANNKPPEWYSVARAAENIKAQVLFLQDKNDELTPFADVEPIIEKNYPNFNFVISERLGHQRIYRDSGSIEKVMKFF